MRPATVPRKMALFGDLPPPADSLSLFDDLPPETNSSVKTGTEELVASGVHKRPPSAGPEEGNDSCSKRTKHEGS